MSDDAKTLEYALRKGGEFPRVGMRRDGVGGPWHYKNWIGSKNMRTSGIWTKYGSPNPSCSSS